MKCLTWNLEWAAPRSKRAKLLADKIAALDPEVTCYTEVALPTLPPGHIIEASPDYGYKHDGTRRKVVLLSKKPWTEIDMMGDPDLPSGRFVSGVTRGVRFIGVCILLLPKL